VLLIAGLPKFYEITRMGHLRLCISLFKRSSPINDEHSLPRIAALITVHVNMGACLCVSVPFFMQLKPYFIFFYISADEESTQPTKYANKILVSIFLTMKATILA